MKCSKIIKKMKKKQKLSSLFTVGDRAYKGTAHVLIYTLMAASRSQSENMFI